MLTRDTRDPATRPRLLFTLLLGSVPAGIAGAMLSARLPHATLRIALAVVLFLVGTKLAVASW